MNRHAAAIKAGGLTIAGESTAGIATSLRVAEFDLCYDVGTPRRDNTSMDTLLLTHGHPDHIGSLVSWLGVRKLQGMVKAKIYAGPALADDARAMVELGSKMQRVPLDADVILAAPGERYHHKGDLWIAPFEGQHAIETTGYAVVQRKSKLKREFRALPGAEIAKLRAEGHPGLFDELEEVRVAYAGDCAFELVKRTEHMRIAQVLILECTYLDDQRPRERAQRWGHVHIDDICENLGLFENDHLVLVHFSQIYSPSQVERIVEARLRGKMKPQVHVLTSPT